MESLTQEQEALKVRVEELGRLGVTTISTVLFTIIAKKGMMHKIRDLIIPTSEANSRVFDLNGGVQRGRASLVGSMRGVTSCLINISGCRGRTTTSAIAEQRYWRGKGDPSPERRHHLIREPLRLFHHLLESVHHDVGADAVGHTLSL